MFQNQENIFCMKKINFMKTSKVWIGVAVLVIASIIIWLVSNKDKESKVTFTQEKVEPQTLQSTITATGTIEPVTSISVGTQVSGIVSKVYVDYNSVVKKGQIIAELDKTNLISQLNSTKATLSKAKSNLLYQSANFKRYSTLYKKGLVRDRKSTRLNSS